MNNGYTPTETAILNVLMDGKPHSKAELHKCLPDELSELNAVKRHIHELRKRLRPQGQDILLQFVEHTLHYRQVRLISKTE